MMVTYKLNENLNVIAGGQNLNYIAFNLVGWAESQEQVRALVRGACEMNLGNRLLKRFVEKYM